MAQTYERLEVILVDDGSTDGGGDLCDAYARADRRVTALHKPNGGLSDARNHGLAAAHGDWVAFVDCDDYVSPVYVEALLTGCVDNGCAIAALPFWTAFWDGEDCALVEEVSEVERAVALTPEEALRMLLYQKVETSAWLYLYRRDLLGDDPFPVGLLYEDLATVYRAIHRADGVAHVDCRGLYAYRQRRDSIMRGGVKQELAVTSATRVADQLEADISAWHPGLGQAAASRVFSLCRMVYSQIASAPEGDGETERLESVLWRYLDARKGVVLRDAHARKRERVAAAAACLGPHAFDAFCALCRRMGLMR